MNLFETNGFTKKSKLYFNKESMLLLCLHMATDIIYTSMLFSFSMIFLSESEFHYLYKCNKQFRITCWSDADPILHSSIILAPY